MTDSHLPAHTGVHTARTVRAFPEAGGEIRLVRVTEPSYAKRMSGHVFSTTTPGIPGVLMR